MKYAILIAAASICTLGKAHGRVFESIPDHITSQMQVEALADTSLGAVGSGEPRVLLPLALDMIKDYEKWIPLAYDDASRYCTIGYGHLIARLPCATVVTKVAALSPPISIERGLVLLEKDTALARRAVLNLVQVDLNDNQFGALTSFVFNVGATNFGTSTLLKMINNGEFDLASAQFDRWVVSKGKALNGLKNRRACERLLFIGELKYHPVNKFMRDDCEGLSAVPETSDLIDISVGERR